MNAGDGPGNKPGCGLQIVLGRGHAPLPVPLQGECLGLTWATLRSMILPMSLQAQLLCGGS